MRLRASTTSRSPLQQWRGFLLPIHTQENPLSPTSSRWYPKVETSTSTKGCHFSSLLEVFRVNHNHPSVDQRSWRRLIPNRPHKPLFRSEQVGVGPLKFSKRVTKQLGDLEGFHSGSESLSRKLVPQRVKVGCEPVEPPFSLAFHHLSKLLT